jgi:hypothetical protein
MAAVEFKRVCTPSQETLSDGVTEQVARISENGGAKLDHGGGGEVLLRAA